MLGSALSLQLMQAEDNDLQKDGVDLAEFPCHNQPIGEACTDCCKKVNRSGATQPMARMMNIYL